MNFKDYTNNQYSGSYGTPQSQGPQGTQGASQQSTPDSIYDPQRAPMWKPAPSSTASQPTQGSNMRDALSPAAAPGSPVTANGQIAPAQTPSAFSGEQNTSSSQAGPTSGVSHSTSAVTGPPLTIPPNTPDPFAAMGGGVWTGQQWVPRDHPLAQGFQGSGNNGLPQNPAAPQSPYGPYPQRPGNTTYQPGQLPPQQFNPYQRTQFDQYNPMDFSGIQGQQNQLVSQLLSNPVLSEQVVQQMRAKQRESALAMAGQQQQVAAQDAASRGTNLDSQLTNTQNDINNAARENILGAYRDIDINAALQNRQGQLAALDASNSILNGQLDRYRNQYTTRIGGQQAQAQENQYANEAQFRPAEMDMQRRLQQEALNQAGASSNMDAYRTDLGAFFDWQNNLRQGQQLDIQRQLGQSGLDIDRQRLAEQGRQFDAGNQLNWAQLMNDMAMGRYGLGIDYARLQQQGQDSVLRSLGF